MFDSAVASPKLVFLHIPKTAGQTIHNELTRAVGAGQTSPVRVHTQVSDGLAQFPEGFRLYSGHLDWTALDHVPNPRFVFSILRDPKERIASFYFYLRDQAQKLTPQELDLPQNLGKKAALRLTADAYFFGGNDAWRAFIHDHYDNFYCRYFASRRIRAGLGFTKLPERRKLRMALRNLEQVDWVYSVDNLKALEEDLHTLFGFDVNLTSKRDNAGIHPTDQARWPKLLEQFETDTARRKIESYVRLDTELMKHMEW